jgi:rare lipoprotein A
MKNRILQLVVCIGLTVFPSYAASQKGMISYYSPGRASTCAHRTLRFGTIVKVEYRGKVISCRVNDRGPFVRGRILDVSLASAHALGMTSAGIVYATMQW